MCKEYNGWTNYPTWNVNLWILEDSYLVDAINIMALQTSEAGVLSGQIESLCSEMFLGEEDTTSGAKSDILSWAWGLVDWYKIAEHFITDNE